MNDIYAGWKKEEHAEGWEYRKYFPTFTLAKIFDNFNEIKSLNELKKNRYEKFSLLDIGCATGEFYRYFSSKYPNIDYKGCDISPQAIKRAKEKFPNIHFFVVDENLSSLGSNKVEIIFSRDVIVHHTEPFFFLKRLYDISSKYIILRLRTRDVGNSVLDPEVSCQLYNDVWVPFLVLNCDEIISKIRTFTPSPMRMKFVKEYVVLGGQNYSYVPKELYYKDTKTAVTALLIEKGDGKSECQIEQCERKNTHKFFLTGRILSEFVKFLVRRNYKGPVWW